MIRYLRPHSSVNDDLHVPTNVTASYQTSEQYKLLAAVNVLIIALTYVWSIQLMQVILRLQIFRLHGLTYPTTLQY